ncbi:heme peroxidase [Karstenula rhodostoma CBS 690.94]|uniref:Heme peroxidase n=1 Tax=Karstenula rhodostoma CBS 690.94 TaxID=1392251 RepID=A0A9P4PBL8_9PLEO|nr:heme peroxidase [Karstenula rhodostoma CBS 690.94]
MLQGMPLNSSPSEKISDGFITMLWHDLSHPPLSVAGQTAHYRRHDGGGNSSWDPELGKAGSPYARNGMKASPKGPNLPNVEDVYEINETSSYVDLGTLYGNTEKEQKYVRTYENGLIYPKSIASDRIMMMPPAVVAVMLLFSRNHNHTAENLSTVNQCGKYKPWNELDDAGKEWQDEDIFQWTRNINVGFFASVVLRDYVAVILNTPRANSEWSLALGRSVENELNVALATSLCRVCCSLPLARGLSAADDRWMEDIIRDTLPDITSTQELPAGMYKGMIMKYGSKFRSQEPRE